MLSRHRRIIAASLAAFSVASIASAVPLTPIPRGDLSVQLQAVATGMSAPLYGTAAPGDTNRMFVLEQRGLIRILQNDVLQPGNALDMTSLIGGAMNPANANDERGLLGLAFHPGFNDSTSPGFQTLYTFNSQPVATGSAITYAAPNSATQNYKTVINEWKMDPSNPSAIDPTSRREVISFGKNANNHNGGTIAFGPDGFVYLALGDGGNANDVGASHIEPTGNGQNLTTPLGKMIRIDPVNPALTPLSANPVSGNGQYRIPISNMGQTQGSVPEMFAMGFRNPYRYSFDKANGQLIMADVGQNTIEEIDRVVAGGNYGWPIKEGDFLFNRVTGPGGNAGTVGARSPGLPLGLTDPISGPAGTLEYDHGDGISITGGFVYRGTAIPQLVGKYVFGDLALRAQPTRVDGRLFYADLDTGAIKEFLLPQFANNQIPNGLTIHGFGQGPDGELYAMMTNTPANGTGGIIYKLVLPEPTSVAAGAGAIWMVRRRRK